MAAGIIQSGVKAKIEADNERKAYLLSRQRADDLGKILRPEEASDDYDFTRLLYTTLGNAGKGRAITKEDMAQFRANAKILGKKYTGGITISQAINGSQQGDILRANKDIHTAIPVRYKSGLIHFQTNASSHSDKTRHHVLVRFMEYPSAVAAPASSKSVATKLKNAKVAIECDCGRWRYWYRYMATIGKYGIQEETGYPKVRNPDLRGLCCKHILRVLQVIQSPVFQPRIVKMIDESRAKVGAKDKNLTVKQQKEIEKDLKVSRRTLGARIYTAQEKKMLAQVKKINAAATPAKTKYAAKAAAKLLKSASKEAHIKAELKALADSLARGGVKGAMAKTMLEAAEKEIRSKAK